MGSLIETRRRILLNTPHLETASGSMASFQTDMKSKPKQCKLYFSPVQEGTGDPSPDNVRPISGWDGLIGHHTGKNLFSLTAESFNVGSSPYAAAELPVNFEATFSFTRKDSTVDVSNVYFGVSFYDSTIAGEINKGYNWSIEKGIIRTDRRRKNLCTYPTNVDTYLQVGHYAIIYPKNRVADFFAAYDVQLEVEPVTSYEPYTGQEIPVSWQSEAGTLYGGYVDLISGELIADKKLIHLDSNHGWTFNANYVSYANRAYSNHTVTDAYAPLATNIILSDKFICELTAGPHPYRACINSNRRFILGVPTTIDNLESFTEWLDNMGGIDVVYSINPIHYTLTPQQIKIFIGRNNIWSDAGNVEVKYWTH